MLEKTTEEKIDYIYNHIKKEEKILFWRRFSKFLFYLFFIAYIVYFYLYGFEKLKNSIIESIKPTINSEDVVNGLKNNSSDIIEKIKKSEILKKIYENKKIENQDNLETY